MEPKWKILSYKMIDNDIVTFECQHIDSGKTVALEASRAGWEWAVGELLDLSEYGY